MCGKTHRYGAVMSMPKCSTPVQVARSVLQNSPHNVFVGEGALRFAQECSANTLTITDKLHPKSRIEYNQWKKKLQKGKTSKNKASSFQHDTVGVICLDRNGDLAVATSTSGWAFVLGDAPLIGAGLYVDNDVGAAVTTGDGEEIMKHCTSFFQYDFFPIGFFLYQNLYLTKKIKFLKYCLTIHVCRFLKKCTVGVIAMNTRGLSGAASTISSTNPHFQEAANVRFIFFSNLYFFFYKNFVPNDFKCLKYFFTKQKDPFSFEWAKYTKIISKDENPLYEKADLIFENVLNPVLFNP
eukprot:GSMAST32.ASY1.ANO1.102.1 assembled CDS